MPHFHVFAQGRGRSTKLTANPDPSTPGAGAELVGDPRARYSSDVRRLSLCGALLFAAASVGCGPPSPPKKVDGELMVRESLLDGSACFLGEPDFCIEDPEFLDSAIEHAVDARFDGEMPELERDVERLIRSARVAYKENLRSPAGLAKLEEKVAARYADPDVDDRLVDGIVNADLGAVPGRLAVRGRGDHIRLAESDLLERGELRGDEVGRRLAALAKAHPKAEVIRLEVEVPQGVRDQSWVYRYHRDLNQVVMHRVYEKNVRIIDVPEGGVDAMAAGKLVIDSKTRRHCGTRSGADCPNDDRYGDAARKAQRDAK